MKQIESMPDFFDSRVHMYEGHMRETIKSFNNYYKNVSKPIKKTANKILILDLGCGTGLEIKQILKKAPNALIYCVDISKGMLKKLKENYPANGKNLKLINKSYLEYKPGINKFDYVVSVMTIHHLEQALKLRLYKKIKRSLKKGGSYIEGDYYVDQTKEKRLLSRYLALKRRKPDVASGKYHIDIPFSIKTQTKLFKEAGFDQIIDILGKTQSIFVVK